MPHDPNEEFDHAVLDLIEHSPTGAVPVTPSYQDALRRLTGSHQIFADADHKDGYVTGRALAKLPTFHARNLDELIAGRITPEQLEPNAAIFDRYAQSLPADRRAKAEARRAGVVGKLAVHRKHGAATEAIHDPVHSLFLVPGAGANPGIPGNYLYGMVYEAGTVPPHPWAVDVHDGHDGLSRFETKVAAEAFAKLRELLDCAPFRLDELDGFGFRPI